MGADREVRPFFLQPSTNQNHVHCLHCQKAGCFCHRRGHHDHRRLDRETRIIQSPAFDCEWLDAREIAQAGARAAACFDIYCREPVESHVAQAVTSEVVAVASE